MSDDTILGHYGSDTAQPQRERAECGGTFYPSGVTLPYPAPVGPKRGPVGVGLSGSNHGSTGTQGKH